MLKERALTALLLLALVLWCVFTPWPLIFPLFAGVLTLLAAWEWTALMRWPEPRLRATYVALIGLALACLYWSQPVVDFFPVMLLTSVLWLALGYWVVVYPQRAARWDQTWLLSLIGLALFLPTWVALVQLHAQSPIWLMYFFALVWGADTGAYFAGRRWGRRKLAPAVSPGKTREGLWGGLALTTAIALAATVVLSLPLNAALALVAISVVTVLASVLGDLFESMVKRRAGLKDSGNLLPGHGGVLDRIDSLTAAAPVFMAGWWLAGGF